MTPGTGTTTVPAGGATIAGLAAGYPDEPGHSDAELRSTDGSDSALRILPAMSPSRVDGAELSPAAPGLPAVPPAVPVPGAPAAPALPAPAALPPDVPAPAVPLPPALDPAALPPAAPALLLPCARTAPAYMATPATSTMIAVSFFIASDSLQRLVPPVSS
jgi:hypothetical protein